MKSCEEYEIELSSLLDRELPPAAAAEALEHALACADCNHFYRAARRLQEAAVPAAAADDDAQLEPERAEQLWRQVHAAGAPRWTSAAGWLRPLRAAALIVLGVGGGYWLASFGSGSTMALPIQPQTAGTNVTAGNLTPAMDEHRFVALAAELLGADVRYQRAMLQVLRLVPALETGEGLNTGDGQRGNVHARLEDERPRAGAI